MNLFVFLPVHQKALRAGLVVARIPNRYTARQVDAPGMVARQGMWPSFAKATCGIT